MKKIFFALTVFLLLLSTPCLAGEWNLTGSLNQGREEFCSVILDDGRVLVAGGMANCITLSSCEIYDPNTNEWAFTDSMNYARHHFSLTKLSNGKILATAGCTTISGSFAYITSEIFDPVIETWNQISTLNYGRDSHSTILLQNGKVLVVGGDYDNDYKGCETYNPNTHEWSLTGFCSWPKVNHTLEILTNGQIMAIAGGNSVFNKAELYDSITEEWSELASLSNHRKNHTSHLLPNGIIAVAGTGYNGAPQFLSSCEIYDFQTEEWSFADSLELGRIGHCSESLLNNKILVMAGQNAGPSCEIYNPTTNQWQNENPLNYGRTNFSSEVLFNEQVLVIGPGVCEIYEWNHQSFVSQLENLSGLNEALVGDILTFSCIASDPDNDSVLVRIDWGNGEITDWSDTTSSFSYAWTEPGVYQICSQVADQWFFINELCHNSLSDWTEPTVITITGIPVISISVDSLNFGTVYIGEDSTKTITVSNMGNGILEVELSNSTNEFSVYPESFSLEPGETLNVQITFTPIYEGVITDTLVISSNDPENPEIQVELIGKGETLVDANENISEIFIKSIKAYPNPFNTEITISFSSTSLQVRPARSEIQIFNIKGQIVKSWSLLPTTTQVVWNGTDKNGKPVSSGVYFYKMDSGLYRQGKKIILMK